jgi:hypothetical protein
MSEPLYRSTSKYHHLAVFYEPEPPRFRLEFRPLDRPDEIVATSYCDADYEPIAGIDVSDMVAILNLADTTEDDLLKLGIAREKPDE